MPTSDTIAREELRQRLGFLVGEGKLTPGEMRQVLELYDQGDIGPYSLALSTDASSRDVFAQRRQPGFRVEGYTRGQRQRRAAALVDQFHEAVDKHSETLSRGAISTWQRKMRDTIAVYMVKQEQLALGRALTAVEEAGLQARFNRQAAYLQSFADQMMAQRILDETELMAEFTTKNVKQRARQYAGSGYASFYRVSEQGMEPGVVIEYFARDDGGTCSPCLEAQERGPYLPGEGPMPGDVCLGRGHCRCEREPVLDMAAYLSLGGRPPLEVAA